MNSLLSGLPTAGESKTATMISRTENSSPILSSVDFITPWMKSVSLYLSISSAFIFSRGTGQSGTGLSRKVHNGSQPCFTFHTSSRSGGTTDFFVK